MRALDNMFVTVDDVTQGLFTSSWWMRLRLDCAWELAEGTLYHPYARVAADLGVNLNTVALPIDACKKGLIRVRHGSGAVVIHRR